ncbi:MAG: LytR/AlgR family response regulator transcription factor [Bacteroidota bacterium]
MKNIKILIVEDEVLIAEHIKDYLTGFGFSQLFMAHTRKTAIQTIEHIQPDLVLLDLHLEKSKDGIDIARYIDENQNIPYIFITANADILIVQEAIKTKAAGYITKPIKKTDFFASIQLALKPVIQSDSAYLMIKENNEIIKIKLDEILYIESNSNYIFVFTKTKKVVTRQSLEWAELQLPKNQFIRIHRSYIVNIQAVEKLSSKFVYINQVELPVSRTHSSKINEYILSKR